jgi:hypothetical protein
LASVPITPAADWAANRTKNPQHSTDNQQYNADRLQDSDFQDESQDQQDYAESNHDAFTPISWSMSLVGIELGCGK